MHEKARHCTYIRNQRKDSDVLKVSLVLQWLKQHMREDGQGLVEYALIIALVAILLVAALTTLQGQISTVFSTISADL